MPYIEESERTEVLFSINSDCAAGITREYLGELVGDACENGGQLQFILAVAIQEYINRKGLNYQNCQDIMGALSGALAEFQRLVVGPYENLKIQENGGIYMVTVNKKEY